MGLRLRSKFCKYNWFLLVPSTLKETIDSHKFSWLEVLEDCTEETDDERIDFVTKERGQLSVLTCRALVMSVDDAWVAFM